MSKVSPADIYFEQLEWYGRGSPLWMPNAGTSRYAKVEVGDVGVIREGRFLLLFNVFKDSQHERNQVQGYGVPKNFTPLVLRKELQTEETFPETIWHSESGFSNDTSISLGGAHGPIEAIISGQYTFSRERGAMLRSASGTMSTDTDEDYTMYAYADENKRHWIEFQRDKGVSGVLRFVTGVDQTATPWWSAVQSQSKHSIKGSGSVAVPGLVSVQISSEGRWSQYTGVTPLENITKPHHTNFNQTIFLRAFSIKTFLRSFPKVVKGGADPVDLEADRDNEEDTAVIAGVNSYEEDVQEYVIVERDPVSRDSYHPADALLDHLLETSEDDIAIVHDKWWCGRFPQSTYSSSSSTMITPGISEQTKDIAGTVDPKPHLPKDLLPSPLDAATTDCVLRGYKSKFFGLLLPPSNLNSESTDGARESTAIEDTGPTAGDNQQLTLGHTGRASGSSQTPTTSDFALPAGPTAQASKLLSTYDFDEVIDEDVLKTKSIVTNRSPLMTAWATLVAERMGFQRAEALSIGSVFTEMNAQSKGESLGMFEAPKPIERSGPKPYTELMGRRIPLQQSPTSQWRALSSSNTPTLPYTAFTYVSRAFGQSTPHVVGALRLLVESYPQQEINEKAWSLYCKFRPEVDEWGKKGEVKCEKILSLRRQELGSADGKVEGGTFMDYLSDEEEVELQRQAELKAATSQAGGSNLKVGRGHVGPGARNNDAVGNMALVRFENEATPVLSS